MRKIFAFVTLCLLACSLGALAQGRREVSPSPVNVIPRPVVIKVQDSTTVFAFNDKTKILYQAGNADAQRLADLLSKTISEQTGVVLKPEMKKKQELGNTIQVLVADLPQKQVGAYTLDVTTSGIVLTGATAHGIFYGIQTLRQLIPYAKGLPVVKTVLIEDYPRFDWRGMHFDVCRHMFSMDYIKSFIDNMSYYKLNKFHWHLTDDQGWRIEIKKYPLLTQAGAWRNGSQYGPSYTKDVDAIPYGGFYTQEQIKEIIDYAATKYIEVIPEIEMPGHAVAAITAYNYLACNKLSFEFNKPFEVRRLFGISTDILCAGNDQVFTFLEDVLTEVMALFPSKYVHIGGDEAPHNVWKKCPKCQQRIKDEGLNNEAELQSYFIRRIEKFVNSKGKSIIGWEEIMEGGLAPNATVMSWKNVESGIKAAKLGHHVIMCPSSHLYFDGYQGNAESEPYAIGYNNTIQRVYGFEPYADGLKGADTTFVIGVQANLWSEYMPSEQVHEYMSYPRILALAEIAWTPRISKSWSDFKRRVINETYRLDRIGMNYRIAPPEAPNYVYLRQGETFELKNSWERGIIRYTTDGTEPNQNSPEYTKPLTPRPGTVIRSAVFLPNGRYSSVWTTLIREKNARNNYDH